MSKINEKAIGALITSANTKLWKSSIAYGVMFHMVGTSKPSAAIATFVKTDDDKRDYKTFTDALRGVWPSAGTFYHAIMTVNAKRALLDMSASDARDAVLKAIDAHITALDLPASVGRGAYLARIQFADKAAYDVAMAIQTEAQAKSEESEGATVENPADMLASSADAATVTTEDQPDTFEGLIKAYNEASGKDQNDMVLKHLEACDDGELNHWAKVITDLMLARQTVAIAA